MGDLRRGTGERKLAERWGAPMTKLAAPRPRLANLWIRGYTLFTANADISGLDSGQQIGAKTIP
jgi:hypothetical protein